MNTRIQQIMEQSGLQPYYNGQEVDIAKFAELLVKECVQCAEGEFINNGDTEHNRAVSGVIESIKQHFGVTE